MSAGQEHQAKTVKCCMLTLGFKFEGEKPKTKGTKKPNFVANAILGHTRNSQSTQEVKMEPQDLAETNLHGEEGGGKGEGREERSKEGAQGSEILHFRIV